MTAFLLEIAAFSLASAIKAQSAGADRIELCENPFEGGTTPSFGTLKLARQFVQIPVFPIIRPRGGDFCYNNEEFSVLRQDILLCKQLGFEGVVTGILLSSGDIDLVHMKQLVEAAYPMEVTFHRAFDRCRSPLESLEKVIESGCQRILTSGQHPNATDGTALIRAMVNAAADRIIIMPGSGIRSQNLEKLAIETGCAEFHSSARILRPSTMDFTVKTMQEELVQTDVDEKEVAALKTVVQGLAPS
jgi:copper homeostasis protein